MSHSNLSHIYIYIAKKLYCLLFLCNVGLQHSIEYTLGCKYFMVLILTKAKVFHCYNNYHQSAWLLVTTPATPTNFCF